MEIFFKVKVVALCLFVGSLVLISCNEDEESISQESLDSVEHINKNAILAFSSKEDIKEARIRNRYYDTSFDSKQSIRKYPVIN